MNRSILLQLSLALGFSLFVSADHHGPKLLFKENFSRGTKGWKLTDNSAWELTKVAKDSEDLAFELTKKRSDYKPPHRSPFNIALCEGVMLDDFVLTAKVKSTHPSYGHRDLCFFFGYQDPAHFYYVHLGQETDDHANQIFIVDGKPRVKISSNTTEGTPWQDNTWHLVKIERRASTGSIAVYFDDMSRPIMEATDKTFGKGLFGIGSFDDTGMWDDIEIHAPAN